MLDKGANAGRHAMSDRPGNRYDTHAVAVEALLRVETLPKRIWEPCCGKGNIVKILRAHHHHVVASDIRDRKCPDSFKHDFLDMAAPYVATECDAIVTNPPYDHAAQFISNALEHVPKVCMLLRLAFLEGGTPKTEAGRLRARVLDGGDLARVHVFANRLPMMHRAGWKGPRASSAIAFAWFVWEREHRGPTKIDRIRWE